MPSARDRSNPASLSLKSILSAAFREAGQDHAGLYVWTTVAIGFLYTLISILIYVATPLDYRLFVWLFMSFGLAVSFGPLRNAVQELIRQMFPEIDYNALSVVKQLNTISYSSLTLTKLSRTFFETLERYLDVAESGFIFIQPRSAYTLKTNDAFKRLMEMERDEIRALCRVPAELNSPYQLAKHTRLRELLAPYKAEVAIPLANNDTLVGMLVLGRKHRGRTYTTKDMRVLAAIAPKIGFAIRNAFAYERVKRKNRTLFDDQQEMNRKLSKANRQLKHDDKLKDEFIFVTTHELKNPVTAMRGYLSLILEEKYGAVPPKMKAAIEQIHSSNQQLIVLLNNLLNIARSEATKINIKPVPVAICDVIDAVAHEVQPLIDQKGLKLSHSCPNPAVTVLGDRDILREVMSNLLSNAIKYSDRGTMSVTHEIEQDMLVTHVADEGIGIPKEYQKKIFTRFFRVEEEAHQGVPGTGLGLFIVKQHLEQMGGKIWFESEEDKGSTFSFALPLAHSPAAR